MEILLHKEALTRKAAEKLLEGGVVAIRVEDPSNFHLMSARLVGFDSNDMMWAIIDAIDASGYGNKMGQKLVENLKTLAEESRAK